MNDPPRLLESAPDEFERTLLQAAEHDRGSRLAQARCLAIVTAAAVPLVPAVAAASAASATISVVKAAALGLLIGVSVSGAGVLVKSEVIGTGSERALQVRSTPRDRTADAAPAAAPVVGGVEASDTSGAAFAERADLPREVAVPLPSVPLAITPSSAALRGAAAPSKNAAAMNAAAFEDQLLSGQLSGIDVAHSERGTEDVQSPSALPTQDGFPATHSTSAALPLVIEEQARNVFPPDRLLEREVMLLDEARRALARGALESSRGSLDQYVREFPAGKLQPEATLLRAQVLMATGQRPAAEALARTFLARYPRGAYAKRMRAVIQAGP